MKHCLIIQCSDAKNNITTTAFNLYTGVLKDIINTFDLIDVWRHFEIFFLSAKHGLIHSNTVIASYVVKMPSSDDELRTYAKIHKRTATLLLNQYANKSAKLFTVFSFVGLGLSYKFES